MIILCTCVWMCMNTNNMHSVNHNAYWLHKLGNFPSFTSLTKHISFIQRKIKKKKKKLKSEKNLKVFFLLLLAEVGNVILKFINFLHRGDFAKTQEGRKTVWHMCYSLQRPQINYWEKKLKPSDNGSPEVELQPWVAASAFPGQNFSLFVCCSGMGT